MLKKHHLQSLLFVKETKNSIAIMHNCSHNHTHIRPLAVSPLDYSECVPIPWGFFVPVCFTSHTSSLSQVTA